MFSSSITQRGRAYLPARFAAAGVVAGLIIVSGCGGSPGSTIQGHQPNAPAAGNATDGTDEPPAKQPTATPTDTVVTPSAKPYIALTDTTGQPGGTSQLDATLFTAGALIAGAQIDIAFPPSAPIAANEFQRPNCRVNPDINKNGTAFAFQPPQCSGGECTALRAVVISLETVDPIPDGSVLFTCTVAISVDATGVLPFKSGGVILSASDGSYVAATGGDGSVTVAGDPLPTQPPRPPTASATPTVAVTPTPVDTITVPAVEIDRVSVAAGDLVQITATLRLANNEEVVALQNDLCVPPGVRIAPKPNGKPDCTVNPDIMKKDTSFTLQPAPFTSEVCTGVRAIVIALGDDADSHIPISDGAVLYTCKLDIAADAMGSLVLQVTNVVMSDSLGQRVPDVAGIDGVIDIVP